MINYKKLFLSILIAASALQTECGTAATLLASSIDPTNGGAIVQPGSYYLGWDVGDRDQNIFATISIETSDVILDMNGHLLTGVISINEGLSNITITNGVIQPDQTDATAAITVNQNNDNVTLSDLTIRNLTDDMVNAPGIVVNFSTNIFLTNVRCYGASTVDNASAASGLGVFGCNSLAVSNCIFSNWFNGIDLLAFGNTLTTNVTFSECSVSDNTQSGILAESTAAIEILDCFAFSNLNTGFTTTGGSSKFQAFRCISDGFGVTEASRGFLYTSGAICQIELCFAQNHNGIGFSGSSGSRSIIKECTALNNDSKGFFNDGAIPSLSQYVANFANNNNGSTTRTSNFDPDSGDPFKPIEANNSSGGNVAQYWRNVVQATGNCN